MQSQWEWQREADMMDCEVQERRTVKRRRLQELVRSVCHDRESELTWISLQRKEMLKRTKNQKYSTRLSHLS